MTKETGLWVLAVAAAVGLVALMVWGVIQAGRPQPVQQPVSRPVLTLHRSADSQ